MTGRTHDLAALTALVTYIAVGPVPSMTVATAIVSFGANMIGGLLPDIDNATSDIWKQIRGGTLIGKIVSPLLGHHRMISHSLLGIVIAGYLTGWLLSAIGTVLIVDMHIVWWAVMAGYVSHLIMDSLTVDGVPWLFPLPVRFGFPPVKFLRVKTGSWAETLFVFPGLLLLNAYFVYTDYSKYYVLLRGLIK
jgi:inner membrane protein